MAVIINGTSGITNVNGSASTPAETGTDTDTGIYYGTNTVGLATNGTNALFIDASQRVGIGTSSPSAKLHVQGGNTILNSAPVGNNYVFVGQSASYASAYGENPLVQISQLRGTSYGNPLALYTWGNDGVGAELTLGKSRGTAVGTQTILQNGDAIGVISFAGSDGTNMNQVAADITAIVAGVPGATADMPGALLFRTTADGAGSPTERMRIDSSGNLLVGTTSSNGRLSVDSAGATSATYAVYVRNSTPSDLLYIRSDGFFSTGGAASSPYNATTATAANVVVASNGQLQRSTSSLKYKTDVHDATHGLVDLLKLRSVTYKGKNNGDTIFGGLIAEEVDAAGLTEFVQYADDGTPDALAYGNMVSLCIKAIQEQQALITQLQADIATLKGQA